jgi:aspartate-semialdehyde dehydrogenase
MASIPLETRRIVIAGASSLLGTELKSILEESRFAASDFRLLDEETVAGTLTEAGGEAAVIQPVEEDSFEKAWIVFFTGSSAFTRTNLALARRSGARIVDLSGELAGQNTATAWLPKFGPQSAEPTASLLAIPSAASEIILRLSVALRSHRPTAVNAVAFQPVSATGKPGIEELESQTGQLLSFQPVGKQIFDAQVAYTILDRYGTSSSQSLGTSLDIIRKEIRACLPEDVQVPAVLLLHAPVFYGATVAACAFLGAPASPADIAGLCCRAGFTVTDVENPPSNLSCAGDISLQLAPPIHDLSNPAAWWFWAAADNLRLPAMNAVKLAEKLLG